MLSVENATTPLVFVLPVASPAVPEGLARLRATVTAAHEPSEIEMSFISVAILSFAFFAFLCAAFAPFAV